MSGDPGIFSSHGGDSCRRWRCSPRRRDGPLRLGADGNTTAPLELWYDRPASQWVQALPIGNGRLGAMIFGEVIEEHLQLNDDTLWSGAPRDWDNPKAKDVLPDIRRAVAEGRYVDADQLAKGMMGPFTEAYQPLGDLHVTFAHGDIGQKYRRALDLATGVSTVTYRVGGTTFRRECFASAPGQVIALRLSADAPGALTFQARLTSLHRFHTEARRQRSSTDRPRAVTLGSELPRSEDPGAVRQRRGALRFEVRCRAVVHGGSAAADTDGLRVDAADEVVLLLAAATSYDGFENARAGRYRDPAPVVLGTLDAATRDTWESLRRAHESDHAAIMSRVTLDLGASTSPATATTVERIAKSGASDPQLVALLFAYGRYLLAASSRPGTQPANLQGIWNDMVRPPWSSNYTTNINAEMNYWPAESANLADMHGPLLDFIGEAGRQRREDRADQLRREGLDRRTTTRISGGSPRPSATSAKATRSGRSGRWPARGSPSTSGRTTPFGGDRGVPAHARPAADDGRRRVPARLADRRREGTSGHVAVDVTGAQVRAP